jgi:AraC-like DNA-binding protein
MQAPITAYLLLDHARLPQQQAVGRALRHSARPAEGCGLVPEARADELQLLFDELECRLKKGAYQDSALSLGKLAGSCGLTLHQAWSAINRCLGGNFYDLVNRYRVEEAKRLLRESGESVATICYRAGFNSKSTFNVAFRRHTGLTPKEFRRQGLMSPEAQ